MTSYVGRNPAAVPLLVKLSETLAVPVQLASPSTVNIAIDRALLSLSHLPDLRRADPHVTGPSYGRDDNPVLRDADVVLVVDSDVPWVPVVNVPNSAARVFKLDVDPLKKQFAYHLAQAEINAACDAELALSQLLEAVEGKTGTDVEPRREKLARSGEDRMRRRAEVEAFVPENGTITVPYVLSELRKILPPRTWVASEACVLAFAHDLADSRYSISNYGPAIEHLSISKPGMLRTSGASSLGYALGAAIGAHLASRVRGEEHDLTLAVVGASCFAFLCLT